MPDKYGRVTRTDFITCGGHSHRTYDGLMVNPFTYEVLPDQWCKAYQVASTTEIRVPKIERKVTMSQALWCDRGNHAFSSLDEDMEEGTRKIRRRNALGERTIEEVEFHACGTHSQFQVDTTSTNTADSETKAINGNRTAADDFHDGIG